MKITVDIPESSLSDILRFSGERKKGPAIAKLVESSIMLHLRQEYCNQVMDGKLRVDFPDWRITRAAERKANIWTK
ncbi:MAG: hypothetical protein A3F67_01785 [Verrucomicrobia bacterium RIFCSPHIGHO2_12_FULL_41_10]|nr:MAG: hypothetical protein A3F67_01785 [Verrucomicrobia bacterium RIFCSPHIGHO2_12_FULL_41_10]HLB34016.1 hypothetical protein [Chthoniobacterales bacterium]